MGKRIVFAALLCLCAALILLPAAALADKATSVIVGDQTLDGQATIYATTDTNGVVTLGGDERTYHIKFQDGVLTLKNATIAGVTQDYRGFRDENFAIYAAGELRLVLEGVNTVYSTDNTVSCAGIRIYSSTMGSNNPRLTIEGSGSLHAYTPENGQREQFGICVSGVFNLHSGTVIAEGKNTIGGNSYGVFAVNGLTMTGGTLTATGGDATVRNNFSAGIITSNGDVTISGGNLTATSGTATLSSFGLHIGGSITINASAGGAVKVTAKTTGTALQSHSAFNKQPTLSGGAAYTWRTDERSTPTSSTVTPYTRNSGDTFTELVLAQACATPVISPQAGASLLPQSVTLACATPGAVVRYTTDGTEPTETSAAYTPDVPVMITATATLKAKAFQVGSSPSGTATAAYTITGSAPVIGTQPSNQTVNVGGGATFTVAAAGNPAPSYQWQLSTDGGASWSDLPGHTNTNYTLSAATMAMDGYQYRCAVSNGFLSAVTSSAAILTVRPFHTLTVIHGTGRGDYAAGARVSIEASAPPAGQQFKAWVVTSGGGSIAAPTNATTVYLMPDNDATVTATYEAVVVPPTTGDNSKPLLWLGMCLLGGLGLALALRKKRRA